jgi:5-methylcytosine-specific restriction protein A
MPFDPQLQPGEQITNARLSGIFGCGTQGGMRRAIRTNTLVITTKLVGGLYQDRWEGDVLHYTGMGLTGDQGMRTQNVTLRDAHKTGVDVHLFENLGTDAYRYVGAVELVADPYQEQQLDEEGALRMVWMFPVRVRGSEPPLMPVEVLQKVVEARAKSTRKLSDAEVLARARKAPQKVGSRSATLTQFQRNEWVAENAYRRARGKCELCSEPAPFKDRKGDPYLEVHHVQRLADGGPDTVENTVALCPNCHRKMHSLNLKADQQSLVKVATGAVR